MALPAEQFQLAAAAPGAAQVHVQRHLCVIEMRGEPSIATLRTCHVDDCKATVVIKGRSTIFGK